MSLTAPDTLTAAELAEVTGKRRAASQAAVLADAPHQRNLPGVTA